MWQRQPIELHDWAEFGTALRAELERLNHQGLVLVRNFQILTFTLNQNQEILAEVDRLQLVFTTGVDRDSESQFWNAPGHDFEHDLVPCGKQPQEIIYAYLVDAFCDPYAAHIGDTPEVIDLTSGLSDEDGILIYDPAHLRRVSKNEHWFEGDPLHALLAVFRLAPDT